MPQHHNQQRRLSNLLFGSPDIFTQLIVTALLTSTFLITGCTSKVAQTDNPPEHSNTTRLRKYSRNVGDSFSVFIQTPKEYSDSTRKDYPIVYLLDGDFYFDMLGPIVHRYEEVGMLPPMILVGIGCSDLRLMDSLRDRDFTYPPALPRYKMVPSGGGQKFLAFIQNELMPDIEGPYRADTTKRLLAGHSLGGFFVVYTLLQQLSAAQSPFYAYIAGSPSLNYNEYWLLDAFKKLQTPPRGQKPKLYITYGSLEDAEDADEPGMLPVVKLLDSMAELMQPLQLEYKGDLFSNLKHMDTPFPSFIKGMQAALNENQQ